MVKKLDKRNSIKVVMQNSFIKARPSQNMEANAQKFLRMSMAQCKMKDDTFFEYEVTAVELAEMFGVSRQNIYQHIDKWTSQCMGTVLEFRNSDNEDFEKYALFSKSVYKDGVLRMKLNPDMTPFVLNIKKKLGFTQYELSNILTVKGKYTIRIYEMIMSEMKNRQPFSQNTIEFDLAVDEIRIQTSTEKRYKQIGQLKDNVLNKAIEEIEKFMGWKIETSNVKSGKIIIAIHFKIWSQTGWNWNDTLTKKQKNGEMTQEEIQVYEEMTIESRQENLDYIENYEDSEEIKENPEELGNQSKKSLEDFIDQIGGMEIFVEMLDQIKKEK